MTINDIKVWNNRLRRLFFSIFFLLVFSTARSQEITLLSGTMLDSETNNRSYAWQLEYGEEIAGHFNYSLSYLNEGHLPDHHRDGDIFQFWVYQRILDKRLSIAAGIGPYYYFDTTRVHADSPFSDAHGLGNILSLAATWNTENRWLVHLRTNMIHTQNSIDTYMALIGIGYRFDLPTQVKEDPARPPEQGKLTSNEVTILMGKSILNSFTSQLSYAWCVEFRRALLPYVDWTVAYLDEGDNNVMHRHGFNTQLWLIRNFIHDKLWLGIGGGLYVFNENINKDLSIKPSSESTTGIFSMTVIYSFHPSFDARLTFNRISSHNNLDADMILGGLGYRF
jgi:hypothetical protein